MITIIGFAAMTFAMWKLYKRIEKLYDNAMEIIRFRTDETEFRVVELGSMIKEMKKMKTRSIPLEMMPEEFIVD